MGVIPLTSILSHKGRGGQFHPTVALHRRMITQDERPRNPLVVSLSNHEPRRTHIHLSVAPDRGMKTHNDI